MSKKEEKSNNENDESRSTLCIFAKVGYGAGHVFNDLCATVWFSYTLLYVKDVLEMPIEAGSFMMLGQVTDAIFSAIVGYLTDRYNIKRNWHIMGTAIVAVSFPMIFMLQRDTLPYWGNIFYFSLFITIFQCGWATVQISHLAILPELSLTQTDRSELNSVRYCMSVLSNIIVFMVSWLVLHIQNRSDDRIGTEDVDKFRVIYLKFHQASPPLIKSLQNIAIFLTVFGLLTSILFQVSLTIHNYSSRRQKKIETIDAITDPSMKKPRCNIFIILKSFELYKIALLYTFSRLFFVICIIYIPVLLNNFMKTKNDMKIDNIALIPLIFFVASFVAAFLQKYINQNISQKIVYCAGSLISISGCVWIKFSNNLKAIELFGIAAMLGAGSSITQISSLCIAADLTKDKSEHGGMIYSIVTVCDKLFSGIIIFIIEALDSTQNYYTHVLIFNGFTALFGLIVLSTLRNQS